VTICLEVVEIACVLIAPAPTCVLGRGEGRSKLMFVCALRGVTSLIRYVIPESSSDGVYDGGKRQRGYSTFDGGSMGRIPDCPVNLCPAKDVSSLTAAAAATHEKAMLSS
jgi:hypothetical protein